jgi:hypothetical protein
MGISAELQLLLAAAFFYLYDSSILLHANEGALSPAGGGRWACVYQPNSVILRGRFVYIPNPLLPYRPVYRLAWDAGSVSFIDSTDWAWQRERYALLAPCVCLAGLAIFVLLPICLFLGQSDLHVLTAAALVYANSIAAGIMVIRRRDMLGLGRKRAWCVAAECVLCPPFTLNLIRRLSIREPVAASIPAAGAALLGTDDWGHLKQKLLASQDDAIEDAASDGARDTLLRARAVLMAVGDERDGG